MHFADVRLYFPDHDSRLDAKINLDTLTTEMAGLPVDRQRALAEMALSAAGLTAASSMTAQRDALRADPYYNALQVKYAYAVTCHKAQGGQWASVFVDMGYIPPEAYCTVDFYRWLYTATTRATTKLWLVNPAMDLFDRISEDIKKAMLARDSQRLEALRGVKKEFLEAKTAKGSDGNLTDEKAVQILAKMIKQRKESAEIYTQQNRPELAEAELAQAAVIEEYMPKQLSGEELAEALREIIARVGATSAKEMGKVMGVASKELAGKAEGRAISAKVKELLG